MKTKFFTLFAAMMLLFGAKASAQVNGDVNGDGKVNEQDIAAILEIMAEAGGVKEQTKYYWYAGQTQPTSMSSYPTPDDTTTPPTNDNWHTLAKDATTIGITVVGGTRGNDWYVAVPTTKGLKPTASDLSTPNTSWDIVKTITVNGVEYTVWMTNSQSSRQAVYMGKI